jgi:hypothetical protein
VVITPAWMVREIALRARSILAREPTGDVDVHELATLSLDLVTRIEVDHPYRGSSTAAQDDVQLVEVSALERQLAECRAEIVRLTRRLETLEKA